MLFIVYIPAASTVVAPRSLHRCLPVRQHRLLHLQPLPLLVHTFRLLSLASLSRLDRRARLLDLTRLQLWLDDALEHDRVDQLGECRSLGEGDDISPLLVRCTLRGRHLLDLARENTRSGLDYGLGLVFVDPNLPEVVVASLGLVDDACRPELLDLIDEPPDTTVASWLERNPEELERLSGDAVISLELLDLGDLVVEDRVEDVLDRCSSDMAERVGDEELDVGDRSRRSRARHIEVGHC